MQACGGSDDPINLCHCDNGCHQTIHRIGLLLASTKSGKTSPEDEAIMYARSVNPQKWLEVKTTMLALAVQIAIAVSSLRSGLIAVKETDITIPNVPPRLRKKLIELGKTMKNADGRSIGMSGVVLIGGLELLARTHPELQAECSEYLQQRYGVTNAHAKQIEQAQKVAKTYGIILEGHASRGVAT